MGHFLRVWEPKNWTVVRLFHLIPFFVERTVDALHGLCWEYRWPPDRRPLCVRYSRPRRRGSLEHFHVQPVRAHRSVTLSSPDCHFDPRYKVPLCVEPLQYARSEHLLVVCVCDVPREVGWIFLPPSPSFLFNTSDRRKKKERKRGRLLKPANFTRHGRHSVPDFPVRGNASDFVPRGAVRSMSRLVLFSLLISLLIDLFISPLVFHVPSTPPLFPAFSGSFTVPIFCCRISSNSFVQYGSPAHTLGYDSQGFISSSFLLLHNCWTVAPSASSNHRIISFSMLTYYVSTSFAFPGLFIQNFDTLFLRLADNLPHPL